MALSTLCCLLSSTRLADRPRRKLESAQQQQQQQQQSESGVCMFPWGRAAAAMGARTCKQAASACRHSERQVLIRRWRGLQPQQAHHCCAGGVRKRVPSDINTHQFETRQPARIPPSGTLRTHPRHSPAGGGCSGRLVAARHAARAPARHCKSTPPAWPAAAAPAREGSGESASWVDPACRRLAVRKHLPARQQHPHP